MHLVSFRQIRPFSLTYQGSSTPCPHLHADDPVDEEDECDEDADPGERLEGLDEGPEQRADALALREQLDEAHHAEQPEEVDGDHVASGLQEKRSAACYA